jgi:chlorophyllide a reductase subunit Y
MLAYARREIMNGAVQAPRGGRQKLPSVALIGEIFPADPIMIGKLLEPLGIACGPTVPTREWRELYGALDCQAAAALHPFYTASVREFEQAGRKIIASAPVGCEGTIDWLASVGAAMGVDAGTIARAQNEALAPLRQAIASAPIKGRITVSGYEGSELLVARLLVESGADVRYVGTACPRTTWSAPDKAWLEAKGVDVKFRSSLEQDIAAVEEFKPDLAIGTTPVVQHAKQRAIPALYFTNLISARPLMGAAGAGSLAQVVNGAIANKDRFDRMHDFFRGVGEDHKSGVWPEPPPERSRRAPVSKKPDSEVPVGGMEEAV